METDSYKFVATILAISKGGTDATSYSICRMLSRAFDVIECRHVIDFLLKNKYILKSFDSISDFEVTTAGKSFLENHIEQDIEHMKGLTVLNDSYKMFIIKYLTTK